MRPRDFPTDGSAEPPGQQRGQGEAGEIFGDGHFFQLQNDKGHAKNEEAIGGVDGINQGTMAEGRLQQGDAFDDRALPGQKRDGGQHHAPAKGGGKGQGADAIHDGFDEEDIGEAVQAFLDRSEDAQGCGAKERGGDLKAFVELGRGAGGHFAGGELADAVGKGLEAEEFAGQFSKHHGQEHDAELFEDLPRTSVQAGDRQEQTQIDGEGAEEDFEPGLGGDGKGFFEDEGQNAAEEDACRVNKRAAHEGMMGLGGGNCKAQSGWLGG